MYICSTSAPAETRLTVYCRLSMSKERQTTIERRAEDKLETSGLTNIGKTIH